MRRDDPPTKGAGPGPSVLGGAVPMRSRRSLLLAVLAVTLVLAALGGPGVGISSAVTDHEPVQTDALSSDCLDITTSDLDAYLAEERASDEDDSEDDLSWFCIVYVDNGDSTTESESDGSADTGEDVADEIDATPVGIVLVDDIPTEDDLNDAAAAEELAVAGVAGDSHEDANSQVVTPVGSVWVTQPDGDGGDGPAAGDVFDSVIGDSDDDPQTGPEIVDAGTGDVDGDGQITGSDLVSRVKGNGQITGSDILDRAGSQSGDGNVLGEDLLPDSIEQSDGDENSGDNSALSDLIDPRLMQDAGTSSRDAGQDKSDVPPAGQYDDEPANDGIPQRNVDDDSSSWQDHPWDSAKDNLDNMGPSGPDWDDHDHENVNTHDHDDDGDPDMRDNDGDGDADEFDSEDSDQKMDGYDTDDDGKADAWETGDGDSRPDVFDTDGDGKEDAKDTNDDGVPDLYDTDGDGKADARDSDDPDAKPDEFDTNGDGYVDKKDTDGDGEPDTDIYGSNQNDDESDASNGGNSDDGQDVDESDSNNGERSTEDQNTEGGMCKSGGACASGGVDSEDSDGSDTGSDGSDTGSDGSDSGSDQSGEDEDEESGQRLCDMLGGCASYDDVSEEDIDSMRPDSATEDADDAGTTDCMHDEVSPCGQDRSDVDVDDDPTQDGTVDCMSEVAPCSGNQNGVQIQNPKLNNDPTDDPEVDCMHETSNCGGEAPEDPDTGTDPSDAMDGSGATAAGSSTISVSGGQEATLGEFGGGSLLNDAAIELLTLGDESGDDTSSGESSLDDSSSDGEDGVGELWG